MKNLLFAAIPFYFLKTLWNSLVVALILAQIFC